MGLMALFILAGALGVVLLIGCRSVIGLKIRTDEVEIITPLARRNAPPDEAFSAES